MSLWEHTHTHTQTYVVSRVACCNVSSVFCHAIFCIHPFSCVIVKQTNKNTDHTLTNKLKQLNISLTTTTFSQKPFWVVWTEDVEQVQGLHYSSQGPGLNFCGPPFSSDPMNSLYTIAVLHQRWWNSVYRTSKCMRFYLQKGWAALDSSKMKTIHSISQNTSL